MAKRSRDIAHARMPVASVEPLFRPGWHPLTGERERGREQSYVRTVRPQSENQRALMAAIESHNLTITLGPAGTGKTYLAVTAAVEALEAGRVGRIVLTRPAVEADAAGTAVREPAVGSTTRVRCRRRKRPCRLV